MIYLFTCHLERSRDIFKEISSLTSFGRNDSKFKVLS